MTKQAKSDAEIYNMARIDNGALGYDEEIMFHRGYRQAESELLPIINQQAEENEKLKAENTKVSAIATATSEHCMEVINKYAELQSRLDELKEEVEKYKSFDDDNDNLVDALAKLRETLLPIIGKDRDTSALFMIPSSVALVANAELSMLQSRFDELVKSLENIRPLHLVEDVESLITKAKGRANGEV